MPVVIVGKIPKPERPRTRRQLAHLIALLQEAEAARLHGVRDHCEQHLLQSSVVIMMHAPTLPKRVDVHKHVRMPAARIDAKRLDERLRREH